MAPVSFTSCAGERRTLRVDSAWLVTAVGLLLLIAPAIYWLYQLSIVTIQRV